MKQRNTGNVKNNSEEHAEEFAYITRNMQNTRHNMYNTAVFRMTTLTTL
jgi:hypothetical protein